MDSKVIQAGKFDQRSTGAERRQMLERIIQEESDGEEEDDVPDDDNINEMLARAPHELDLFTKMDLERRRGDAELDPRNRKPRLLEENEIPTNILEFAEKFDIEEAAGGPDVSFGDLSLESGRRRRREVDYSADLMSEHDFMRQLEEDEDEEETSRSSGKRARKIEKATPRSKRRRYDDEEDDEDSRISTGGETPLSKKAEARIIR